MLSRSLGGCGDPLCVTARCRRCHPACDRGELDLLTYLEPVWRAQLAYAVGHVGLIGALRRITAARGQAGGVSFAGVSECPPSRPASSTEDGDSLWKRNERIRQAELEADSRRPMGELLEEGVELSRVASELAASARRVR